MAIQAKRETHQHLDDSSASSRNPIFHQRKAKAASSNVSESTSAERARSAGRQIERLRETLAASPTPSSNREDPRRIPREPLEATFRRPPPIAGLIAAAIQAEWKWPASRAIPPRRCGTPRPSRPPTSASTLVEGLRELRRKPPWIFRDTSKNPHRRRCDRTNWATHDGPPLHAAIRTMTNLKLHNAGAHISGPHKAGGTSRF